MADPGRRSPELVDQGRDAVRVLGLGRPERHDSVSESRAPHHNGPPAQAIVTIYWDSYNQDPELIEKARLKHRETCRQSFAARSNMGKLRLHRASRPALTDVDALAAFAEAAGTAAPRAAYDAAAARDDVRARALAASRTAASLENAAAVRAVPPVPPRRVEAVAPTAAPRYATCGAAARAAAAVSVELTPAVASPARSDADVVMLEDPSPSAASAPQELVDDVFGDLDDEEVQEALSAADEPAPPDAYEAFVNALDRRTFRRVVSLACSRVDRERYAPLTQKIPKGIQLGNLGAALVADFLSEPGHPVTEADVRGGAACPFHPVCETVVARTREAVVRNTASRRSAIRTRSGVSRKISCSARTTRGSSPTSP